MSRILQIILLAMSVVVIAASGCYATANSTVDSQYRAARDTYIKLHRDVAKQQYRHNWDRVLKKLHKFTKEHPHHPKAASAYYLLGKAYRGLYKVSRLKKDAQDAVASFGAIAKKYDNSSLADDALYLQADIDFNVLHRPELARARCKRIIDHYPHGDMIAKAKQLWKKLPPQKLGKKTVKAVKKGKKKLIFITKVRCKSNDESTRVVVELTDKATYRVNTLAPSQKDNAPYRIYFDIIGARMKKNLPSSIVAKSGVVKKIRVGENSKYTRIVCDMGKQTRYNVFELTKPYRIVIDVANKKGVELKADIPQLQAAPGNNVTAAHRDIAAVLNKVPAERQPMRVKLPGKKKGKLRIVVDAGHGGKDPGAIGYGRLYEKNVALKIARLLSDRLRRKLGCEVLLTRNRDVFIPLHERTAFANKVDADLFISIHANASRNKKAYGIETFYLNFSKNDKAVAVAARENGMSLKEVGDLELILFDLMANSKINESSRLAAEIQSSLVSSLKGKYSNIKNLGVRQGPFHVLLGATMPSVLVETAFISNKREAKRLNSRAYCERCSDAIVKGVKRYLQAQKLLR